MGHFECKEYIVCLLFRSTCIYSFSTARTSRVCPSWFHGVDNTDSRRRSNAAQSMIHLLLSFAQKWKRKPLLNPSSCSDLDAAIRLSDHESLQVFALHGDY